jgi:transposase
MPKRIKMRKPTADEKREIVRLANARKEPAQLVKRAQVLQAIIDDPALSPSKAGQLAGYANPATGIQWVERFNAEGLDGLKDRQRPGAPAKHSQEVRSQLVNLALQKPEKLGYPFALWTLERLQNAFKERHGVHLSDSTIWTWMDEEGFEWKRQESWFHNAERHDPEFVEKRGPSSDVT